MTDHPTVVDLFSGAGGLSCGLEMAGFRIVLGSDIHPVYGRTYQANHPDSAFHCGDIRKLNQDDLPKRLGLGRRGLTLLAGGPPCQGFSINAPIRSLDDQRNHLFRDFLRIAEILKPRAILIENVPGIISLGKGTVVDAIYASLHALGYSVKHRILFAAYYGIPQLRFRTVFIALRNFSGHINFPAATHYAEAAMNFTGAKHLVDRILPLMANSLQPHTTSWDAISDLPPINAGDKNDVLPYRCPARNAYQKFLRADSTAVANHCASRIAPINLERLRHIPQGGSWRDIPFDLLPAGLKRARRSDHTKRYGRLHPKELCSTVLTKCDPHWGSFFHPYQSRIISVREAARIQSFPDKFVFHGAITEQYEQVGNAVPPILGKVLGETILSMVGPKARQS